MKLKFERMHLTIEASFVMGLAVLFVYAPVIFLGQSYDESNPMIPNFVGINGKSVSYESALDPGGISQALPPVSYLARSEILEGKPPLWNPYQGTGYPLAADTDNWVMSPIFLGYLLPVALWDIPLYVSLWLAGIFTYLFLKNMGLNFPSSIVGGMIYMFSGIFTWFLPHTLVAVITFTPFIMYSLDKVIQNRNLKYIPLLSVAFAFGILGAHLESIVLQLLIVGLYFSYRIITIINRKRSVILESSKNLQLNHGYTIKRIFFWPIISLIGGLGLSSFFIMFVAEYLKAGRIAHSPLVNWTLNFSNPIALSTFFVPFIEGELQSFWSFKMATEGWHSWGYVGIFALFFSVVGVYLSLKHRNNDLHKYTPLFFFILGIFFELKSINFPVIQWLANPPVFNLISWTRYAGDIIPLCFAVSAAYGINYLSKMEIKKKSLIFIGIILSLIVIISCLPVISLIMPLFPNDKPDIITKGASEYVAFVISRSILLVAAAVLISIATIRNKSAVIGLIVFVILEFSLYIPMGLGADWMIYKSILVLSVMAIMLLLFLQNRFVFDLNKINNVKFWTIVSIVMIAILGEILVSYWSPLGMVSIRDPFQSDPPIDFLREHVGYSRIFSLDNFDSNFPSAYRISDVGYMGAFNIGNYDHFHNNFLDKNTTLTNLGFPSWTNTYGPARSVIKLTDNKKYFDFLGVKYFQTTGYDLNSVTPGPPSTYNWIKVGPELNSITQNFISPVSTIKKIGVSMGTYGLQNYGNIQLTVDSIPFDQKYHRISFLNAANVTSVAYNYFVIDPPLIDTKNMTLSISLGYPETKGDVQKIAVYLEGSSPIGYDTQNAVFAFNNAINYNAGYTFTKEILDGKFYQNNTLVEDKELSFSLVSGIIDYIPVYKYGNVNIYENPDAFPRAFLVDKFTTVEKNKTQDYLLQNPDFDLRHNVILEEQLPENWIQTSPTILNNDSNANITSYSSDKVTISTRSNMPAILVFTDSYYPGWKSYIDGNETRIYLADGLVRAVLVPAGDHNVEFSYDPTSFKIGLIISLTTAIILISFLLYLKIRTRKSLETI